LRVIKIIWTVKVRPDKETSTLSDKFYLNSMNPNREYYRSKFDNIKWRNMIIGETAEWPNLIRFN